MTTVFFSRASLAIAGVLTVSLANPVPARACDCGSFPETAEEALSYNTAVFLGTPLEVIDHTPAGRVKRKRRKAMMMFEVRVRVDRAWKGATPGEVVSLWGGESDCDMLSRSLDGPRVYFAYGEPASSEYPHGRLTPEHCGQPLFGDRSTEEIARLLDAVPSAAPAPQTASPSSVTPAESELARSPAAPALPPPVTPPKSPSKGCGVSIGSRGSSGQGLALPAAIGLLVWGAAASVDSQIHAALGPRGSSAAMTAGKRAWADVWPGCVDAGVGPSSLEPAGRLGQARVRVDPEIVDRQLCAKLDHRQPTG